MRTIALALAVTVVGCASAPRSTQAPPPQRTTTDSAQQTTPGPGELSEPNANPFPSTYKPFPSKPTLIRNVTILTAAGPRIVNGAVLLKDGKIAAVASSADAPEIKSAESGVTPVVIDGTG